MTSTVNNKSEVVQLGTTISIDAMGGDLGPAAVVAGIVRVVQKTRKYISFYMGSKNNFKN